MAHLVSFLGLMVFVPPGRTQHSKQSPQQLIGQSEHCVLEAQHLLYERKGADSVAGSPQLSKQGTTPTHEHDIPITMAR